MKYYVSIAVDGRIEVEVEADNFDEAKEKACIDFYDADLRNLDCIEWHAVNAEDENGEFVDY